MNLYLEYTARMRRIADLNFASSVLSWDQECYMPSSGASQRSSQLSTLAGIGHELATSDELGEILLRLEADNSLDDVQRRNVEETLRDYRRRKKYSREFVEEMSRTVSEAFQSWQEAKEKNDFSIFEPRLSRLIDLKRKECDILGYDGHPYDAMLDLHEPGAKTADITELFDGVRKELVSFVKEIAAMPSREDGFMFGNFPHQKQWDFGIFLLRQMGYDFEAGRQDISSHPFTINFGPQDVRVTTRISENNLNEMIWSCIHEGGHALYEQGFSPDQYGLPCGEAISLGIHESQSRLWENNVGRSRVYWEHNYPLLQSVFPEALGKVSLDKFYGAINAVQPSLIRTSADELTYHFHIMIRFEIEKELFGNGMNAKDLPAIWEAKYREYLGVEVPDHAKGVLQDIHWSHGSFGYFPTYSLGSFYAAQFFYFATKEIEGLEDDLRHGRTDRLLSWLRQKVHRNGRYFSASELCIRISGEPVNFRYFMDYARRKYGEIYKLRPVKA